MNSKLGGGLTANRSRLLVTLMTLASMTLATACHQESATPTPIPPAKAKAKDKSGDGQADADSKVQADISNANSELDRPWVTERALVKLQREIAIKDSTVIDGVAVPFLEMEMIGADFVQVLRCAGSYRLETLTGQSFEEAAKSYQSTSLMRGAWDKAWNDRTSCKVVGEHIISGKYPDLAADSGVYYYVVNPCVSKTRSISRRNECSYNLVRSKDFEYKSQLEARVRDKAVEMAAAESSLMGLLNEMLFIVEKFKVNLRACEDAVAFDRKMLAFKRGMLQIGFFGAGMLLGGLFNVNIGILIGQIGSGVATQVLGTLVFNWPFTVANTCLDPNYAAEARDEDGTIKSVTPLYQRMIDLLSVEIPQATQRVQALQQEIQELDQSIITYDEMITSASAKGIDLLSQDASTGVPAGIPGLGGLLPPQ